MTEPKISALYRYPVKGLSGESLEAATLTAGAYFPHDRLYAIENGPSGFNEDAPEHQPKIKFLMLMKNERLARLHTRFDETSNVLTISRNGKQVSRGDLATPLGRSILEQFFAAFMQGETRGAPKILAAPEGFRFTDSSKGFVSLINLASVRDLARVVGQELNPLRFRGNIWLEGLEPWAEFDFVGKTLRIGGVQLEISKRIERCTATNVNPASAARDTNIPRSLAQAFGHIDCGIYARIATGGTIKPGDAIILE